ncbi:MAG: hypothetical protein ACT4PN_16845 [Nitrospiraceae bacterium]
MKVKASGESMVSEDGRIKINKDGLTFTTTEKDSDIRSYRDQWDRLIRSYERLKKMDEGRADEIHSENYRDEIYAFFMNCHHLKDWLLNDSEFPARTKVESYINSKKELQICADICNAHKHLHLTKKPRSAEQPKVGDLNIESKLTARRVGVVRIEFTIDTASGPVNGFELATKCVDLWRTFI